MALTYLQLKNKLQPYILRFIDKEAVEWIFDSEFLDLVNTCANQLNEAAWILRERYYRKTIIARNYYEMSGYILKIIKFRYEDSAWKDQKYAIVNTPEGEYLNAMLVLKTTPTAAVQMDIHYLRRCGDAAEDTDEIDLPDIVIPEFIELCKSKIKVDFGKQDRLLYEQDLQILAGKAKSKINVIEPYLGRVRRDFGELDTNRDDYYDITDYRLASDHVITNEDGTFTWYE